MLNVINIVQLHKLTFVTRLQTMPPKFKVTNKSEKLGCDQHNKLNKVTASGRPLISTDRKQ